MWKGTAIDLEVDENWLSEMLERVKKEVQVYEVEAVTFGSVPEIMLGWWVEEELVNQYKFEGEVESRENDLESGDI